MACGNLAGIACFSLLIWFSGLVMSEKRDVGSRGFTLRRGQNASYIY
ncbi:Formate efflux transporter (TC 2.A.44 family) [Escherichia coli ISC7]|uniref:Formate efflux transporter (TC 2.A.44 family) n=1 Tax=Escherichia coli ISC7 TaxID=1432555 RepID=W1ETB8_ECOLX|nr:Formate efflux transporter (TC 2.A.44 family) [Escherichia coli ISC7]